MEKISSQIQCWDAQVKVILKVHAHRDLDHRSDTGEGAAGLGVIDGAMAQATVRGRKRSQTNA